MARYNDMLSIVLRRVFGLIFVLLGVTLATFTISRVIPGDPALLMAGPNATPEIVAKLHEQYGFDRPLGEQYVIYMGGLLRGDLGTSIVTRRPVVSSIVELMPATIELMLCAVVVSLAGGIMLGVLAALYRDTALDHAIRIVAVTGISTPGFWLALLLLFLFYGVLGWAPGFGRFDPLLTEPPAYTGFLLLDSLIALDGPAFASAIGHLALPVLTLSILWIGGLMRLVRGSMIEALSEDYIRTARAYGLPKLMTILSYALPNALIPVLTVFGMELASLIFGSVVIETIFSWPGVGSYVLSSIFALDFPVIMGFTVLASITYVIVNLIVDLLHSAIDPRIRSVG